MKVTKAVLPVAGLGTRFLPASKAIPKEMVTVVDKPVVQYVVEEALAAGINEIVLVTHASKKAIAQAYRQQGIRPAGFAPAAARACPA